MSQASERDTTQTSQEFFCVCGELTYDVYYKKLPSNRRQTHHAPKKQRCGNYTNLWKECGKCQAHYSICKIHEELGFQQWKPSERSSKSCTANMWVFCCKKCDPKVALSTVLCPGCKVSPNSMIFVLLTTTFVVSFCRPRSQTKGQNGIQVCPINAEWCVFAIAATKQ